MESIISDVIARTPAVVSSVGANLPPGFPGEVFDVVTKSLRKAAQQIEAMASV